MWNPIGMIKKTPISLVKAAKKPAIATNQYFFFCNPHKTRITNKKNSPSVYKAPKKKDVGNSKRNKIVKLLILLNCLNSLRAIKKDKLDNNSPVSKWLFENKGERNLTNRGYRGK